MSTRITNAFARAKAEKRGAFVAYLTMGYPSLAGCEQAVDDVIALAKRLRARHPETGFVLFSYYNLIFSKGLETFADAVADAGIDAVLSVDLPLEERDELLAVLAPRGVSYVPLIAPNTPIERVKESEAGL